MKLSLRKLIMIAALALCATVGSTNALASPVGNGSTIATAPLVALGQLTQGNAGENPNGAINGYVIGQWWTVKLAAGQTITISWTSDGPSLVPLALDLYSPGTTDASYFSAKTFATVAADSNGQQNQYSFTVPTSGLWPFIFYSQDDTPVAPYHFTITAKAPAVKKKVKKTVKKSKKPKKKKG